MSAPELQQLFDQGLRLFHAGTLDRAAAAFRAVLALAPHQPEALLLLGVTELRRREAEAAAGHLADAITVRPDGADAYANLGIALRACARPERAAVSYRRALRLAPARPEIWFNLGNVLRELGRGEPALACYTAALRLRPDDAEAFYHRGNLLRDRGNLADAIRSYSRTLRLRPDHSEAHVNLCSALRAEGRLDPAIAGYRDLLRLRPDYPEALYNFGNALTERGDPESAARCFRRALRLRPDNPDACYNLGKALFELGMAAAAVDCFGQAVRLRPDFAMARASLVSAMHYDPDSGRAAQVAQARRYGQALGRHRQGSQGDPPAPFANRPDPHRRLRVGYVSADFYRHSVGYFLAPVLAAHESAAVEVFCYANTHAEDPVTARLRAAADHWRPVADLDDDDAAASIRRDGIDVLVDLSGYTVGNRLSMFALRPAPVQTSWLGYWATTGMEAIDSVIMDEVTVPAAAEDWFTERVARIPGGRFCYAPPDDAPTPAPPPVSGRGVVTFGSFNNPIKYSDAVLALWARVLNAVPNARLILKWNSFAHDSRRAELAARFAAAGGDAGRLELRAGSPHRELLAAYGDIDIALDPFPFSGGVTSYEAIWMGVPVITLPTLRPVSRQTLALLTALGLETELAADSADGYLALAAALAGKPERLAALRADLRPRMAASAACDARRVAGGLEAIYRREWARWCRSPAGPARGPGPR